MGWRVNLGSAWVGIVHGVAAKPLHVPVGMNAWLSNRARHLLMASTALQLRSGVSVKPIVTALSDALMGSVLAVVVRTFCARPGLPATRTCAVPPF